MIRITFMITFLLFTTTIQAESPKLESRTYQENFETRELSAWASYPLWQDTAYDPNFRVNEIVPHDPNISIEQRVTPYSHVDNYAMRAGVSSDMSGNSSCGLFSCKQ